MKTLFTELRQLLEQGEEAVLVTIIASSGSTPRGTGSRMLVRKDGSIEGTVGGGAVEYQAPTRHAGRWAFTAPVWGCPVLRGWDSC